MTMSAWLREYASELLRFGLVGTAIAVLQLGTFSLFYNVLRIDQLVSGTIAYVLAVVAHFCLSKSYTFLATQRISSAQVIRYAMLLALNYAITMGCVWASTDLLGTAPQLGITFALLVTALISFLVMKHLIFRAGSTSI